MAGRRGDGSARHEEQFLQGQRQKEARKLIEKSAILNTSPAHAATVTNLDDTDRELIALLRDDARMTVAAHSA